MQHKNAMPLKTMKFGIWMGPLASMCIFMAFFPLMRVFPPPSPTMSVAEFADMFRANRTGFLVGGVFEMCAASIVLPFGAVIAIFMKKIEGAWPVWTYTMLMCIALGYTTVWYGGLFFTITAFRADVSNEMIYMWASASFILMVCPAFTGFIQYVVTGVCILGDKREVPILPRWLGYVNLWVGLLSFPGQMVGVFMRGPFAWNGILAFWVPSVAFGIWITCMMIGMLKALKRLQQDG
jgi:hypothetical protein